MGTKPGDYVIVRTYSAGVFAGEIASKTVSAAGFFEVTLKNARRLWYWAGASSLSQLSVDGTAKPKECKFPCEVPFVELAQGIEILPVSTKARESISSVKVWEQ
jgi:hypothetical protein